MYKSILIPVAIDHEELVAEKITTARKLLAADGKITLLTVLEQIPGFTAEFVTVKSENHLTNKIMGTLKSIAGEATDINCQVETGKPGLRITEFAREIGADLIVVGAHHPSAMDYFLGSTAARVSRRASCSVLIQRPQS
ncbi:universal stress protein [Ruegeria sp. SCSIO 43209]|jgi:nucleotide-binding universal stress UspA family protein|uniref:universal stress protein n=1 Tax=Ruegeria sp. SCSIO 43209 TaxID=2793010 RepID=UPI00147C9D7C|nr:universal stress protein [Ruegeria sp. SCSIO 43209]UAB87895.1 universal stress protein [Ruegeria sp. SCSIO 43209]